MFFIKSHNDDDTIKEIWWYWWWWRYSQFWEVPLVVSHASRLKNSVLLIIVIIISIFSFILTFNIIVIITFIGLIITVMILTIYVIIIILSLWWLRSSSAAAPSLQQYGCICTVAVFIGAIVIKRKVLWSANWMMMERIPFLFGMVILKPLLPTRSSPSTRSSCTRFFTLDQNKSDVLTWKKAMTKIICAKNQEGAWSILRL